MLTITDIRIKERPSPQGAILGNRWYAADFRGYDSKPRCYVFPKGENVIVGRHNRPTDLYRREVVPAVTEKLAAYLNVSASSIKLNWSRTAGCSCGCSPGYIVTASTLGHKPFDIFVDVEAADDAAAVTPEAKPALDNFRTRTGRGPSGKLRNFTAMAVDKREEVKAAVIRENNDPEALAALVA